MNAKLYARGLIVACVIAGAWWWLRSRPAFQTATPPPEVQQFNVRQQANTEQEVNTDQAWPTEPVGAIESQYITVRVAVAAPDPPQVELHAAVEDMLQTLMRQGYTAFADKYLDFPFLDAKVGVAYTVGKDEHLDPSFKALGFGDLNQLIDELNSMQNTIPRYNHDTTTMINTLNGHNYTRTDFPYAIYDLPPSLGGPKLFLLTYVNGKWTISTHTNPNALPVGFTH